ncbi:hypothetical protein [Burkholderia territorii]|uniref:hypothetical protein n=1 Tax=Burkholderia territorii TaxID=1503055 RepID=UPI000759A53A|nr:hypothetical protein [Burkholderia territorii]KWO62595.1 hypothetical protein WT98_30480 [Burkholderia territorii]
MNDQQHSRADALTRESIEAIARKYAGAYFSGLLFQDADSFARFSDEVIAACPVSQPAAAPASANETCAEGARAYIVTRREDGYKWLFFPREIAPYRQRPDDFQITELFTGRSPAMAAAAPADERVADDPLFDEWLRKERGRRCDFDANAGSWARSAWQARAAASPAASIPAGWKFVPVKPTREMLDLGNSEFTSGWETCSAGDVWEAMLEAAPQASQAASPAAEALTDEQIEEIAADFRTTALDCVLIDRFDAIGFARALLAAAPQPAQADANALDHMLSAAGQKELYDRSPSEPAAQADAPVLSGLTYQQINEVWKSANGTYLDRNEFGAMVVDFAHALLAAAPNPRASDATVQADAPAEARLTDDAIARSKRILALVDNYLDFPCVERRWAIRNALMDEFQAAPTQQPSGEVTDDKTNVLIKTLSDIIHDQTVAMQSAIIEWQHGKGAEAGLSWIVNTLEGPGYLPDFDAPHGKHAQFWFNANQANPLPACFCGNPSSSLWMGQGFCCDEHYRDAKAKYDAARAQGDSHE